MALTDLLTQIADSIRSKDGTTDAIKATDFPQRILDIPSGGGSEIIKTNGSFTLSEDRREVTIEHNLGVIPNIINIYPSDDVPISVSVVYDDTHIYFPDNNINTGQCIIMVKVQLCRLGLLQVQLRILQRQIHQIEHIQLVLHIIGKHGEV